MNTIAKEDLPNIRAGNHDGEVILVEDKENNTSYQMVWVAADGFWLLKDVLDEYYNTGDMQ